jgi:hypothetical protein
MIIKHRYTILPTRDGKRVIFRDLKPLPAPEKGVRCRSFDTVEIEHEDYIEIIPIEKIEPTKLPNNPCQS